MCKVWNLMALTDIYPRKNDTQTVYLKNVVNKKNVVVGDYTIYNDFVNDPREFCKNCQAGREHVINLPV